MKTFIGLSGTIYCPDDFGIEVREVQADVIDPDTSDVLITLSGVGSDTDYSFSAIRPVTPQLRFGYNTNVDISSSGTLNTVLIDYVYYGDQGAYIYAASDKPHSAMLRPARLRDG